MRPKLAIFSLCVVLGVLTIFVLAGKVARTSSKAKNQSSMIVTQDGKLTVLTPVSDAMWKLVVSSAKPSTSMSSPSTNSATK